MSDADEIAVLAGGLAHEIRNPLSTIGLNLELLAESLGGTEEDDADDRPTARRKRMLRTVQSECGRLSEILDAFLGFAKAGAPELKPADLNAPVREFADFFAPTAEEAGVRLSVLLADELPQVRLDGRLFRQALINLALNAVQAVTDAEIPRPTLELATRPILAGPAGGAVELSVSDNGPGVPAEHRATMWDPFRLLQTRRQRAGPADGAEDRRGPRRPRPLRERPGGHDRSAWPCRRLHNPKRQRGTRAQPAASHVVRVPR